MLPVLFNIPIVVNDVDRAGYQTKAKEALNQQPEDQLINQYASKKSRYENEKIFGPMMYAQQEEKTHIKTFLNLRFSFLHS